jgi:spermidine synthase
LNFVVAGIAWVLSRSTPAPLASEPPLRGAAEPAPRMVGSQRLVLLSIGLSGACALGAEFVWARNLALLLGGTVYTFALLLGAVLLGLGIGSSMGAGAARTVRNPRRALAVCQTLAMLSLAWAAWSITDQLPNWPINPQLAPSPWFVFQLDFVRALWVVLPAAMCWGASFPLAIAALADGAASSSRAVARVYAANTYGAIVGSLAAGLVLVRWVGTQHTQQIMMVVALVSALLMWLPDQPLTPSRHLVGKLLPAGISVLLLLAAFPLVHRVPGVLVGYGRWAVTWLNSQRNYIYVGEGLNSSLAVSETTDGTRNYHNAGKVQASSTPEDMRLQRMLGHMTTLLARDPKNVLVIGCGAGVTAGAVSISPAVKSETIAEIEPLVPRVVSTYFKRENHGVIDNPKVHVHLDDARHFLLTTDQKFDAITTDPFDTWVKGAATLNTLEFYTEMKRHLNPGGVVTVWIAFYETSEASFKSELATFASVFPNTMVFGNTASGEGYDGVLVGSVEPFKIDLSAIDAKLKSPEYAPVLQSLTDVNYGSVVELFGTFAAHSSQLTGYLADAQINRDRNLRLQYLSGMAVNTYDQARIYNRLMSGGSWNADLFTGDPVLVGGVKATFDGRRGLAAN